MTRGTLVLIMNNAIISSCEFNGDMYPDGHGKVVYDLLKEVKSKEDFEKVVKDFNDECFQYKDNLFYKKDLKWFEQAKSLSHAYYDNWFSDWLFFKNISDDSVIITDCNGKKIEIQPDGVYAFNFGNDPDTEDKKYLGMEINEADEESKADEVEENEEDIIDSVIEEIGEQVKKGYTSGQTGNGKVAWKLEINILL